MLNLKLGITGHRPQKLTAEQIQYIKRHLREQLEILSSHDNINYTLLTGMALGVDTFAAKIAHQLKIPFEAFIPFESFDSRWNQEQQEECRFLLSKASKIHIVSQNPSKQAFLLRDKILVEQSNEMIAYFNSTLKDSGTAFTIEYAKELCKPIKIFAL